MKNVNNVNNQNMTDRQKRAIADMRLLGFSCGEIAKRLRLSYNTIKSYCFRENLTAEKDGSVEGEAENEYCKNCGAVLTHRPGAKRKTFCSDHCRTAWWNRIRVYAASNRTSHICQCCGEVFESYGTQKRKYCGRDCYIRARYGEGPP